MLWAHTYPEYYTDEYNRFLENPKESHEHLGNQLGLARSRSPVLTTSQITARTCYAKNSHVTPT